MKRILILAFSGLLMGSCNHIYYAPNTPNSPLLRQKGEVKLSGMYSAGNESEFEGAEVQFATAVSNHAGIIVSGMDVGRKDFIESWNAPAHEETGHGSYIEFGGGYFTPLAPQTNWIVEGFGGIGFGSIRNTYDYGSTSTVNLRKIFLQPAIGYRSTHVEISFVPRVSSVALKVKSQRGVKDADAEALNFIQNNKNFLAFEPAVLVRAGIRSAKVQVGVSYSSNNKMQRPYRLMETATLSLGLSFTLAPQKTNATKENKNI